MLKNPGCAHCPWHSRVGSPRSSPPPQQKQRVCLEIYRESFSVQPTRPPTRDAERILICQQSMGMKVAPCVTNRLQLLNFSKMRLCRQPRCQLSSTFMLPDLVIVLSSLLRSRGDAVQIRIHLFGKGGRGGGGTGHCVPAHNVKRLIFNGAGATEITIIQYHDYQYKTTWILSQMLCRVIRMLNK